VSGDDLDISPEDAIALVQQGALLLDVREDDEWVAGHAPGAVHIRLSEVPDHPELVGDPRVIVCVCRSGGRSGRAAAFLATEGADSRNLAGGMIAWSEANLPMEGGDGSPTVI
jgi:rhodanese-related sulfurtransferase